MKKRDDGTEEHTYGMYVKVKDQEVFNREAFVYVTGLVEGSEYVIHEKAALTQDTDLKYLLKYINKAKKILHHKMHHHEQQHKH